MAQLCKIIPSVAEFSRALILKTGTPSTTIAISANFSRRFTLDTKPYKLFKLETGPADKGSFTVEEALDIYKKMNIVRAMEKLCGELYKKKIIRGFLHLYMGITQDRPIELILCEEGIVECGAIHTQLLNEILT